MNTEVESIKKEKTQDENNQLIEKLTNKLDEPSTSTTTTTSPQNFYQPKISNDLTNSINKVEEESQNVETQNQNQNQNQMDTKKFRLEMAEETSSSNATTTESDDNVVVKKTQTKKKKKKPVEIK